MHLPTRFLSKVDVQLDGCWNWTGGCSPRGYGNYWHAGKTVAAHRFAAEAALGRPIANGMLVIHQCDNRRCVNPDHLTVGTHLDNMADMTSKQRQAFGTNHVHAKLDPERVMKARLLARDGLAVAEIARRFGVSKYVMQQIVAGRAWKHVPMPAGYFTTNRSEAS